jgi:hypothetical protein
MKIVHLFRVKMVDFQGVCLQRSLRLEQSSGNLFRGVCIRQIYIENLLFRCLDSSNNIRNALEYYQSYCYV